MESLESARFNNSGTETTPLVIRGAPAYTCKAYFLKIEGGNHSTHPLIGARVGPDVDAARPSRRARKGTPREKIA